MEKGIPYGITYWHERRSRNGIPGDALNSKLTISISPFPEEETETRASISARRHPRVIRL